MLRHCKKDSSNKQADALVKDLLIKDIGRFWEEVKNIQGNHCFTPALMMDGSCGVVAVSDMSQKYYEGLF